MPSARGRRGIRGPTCSRESTLRCGGPAGALEQGLIPAAAAGPVVLSYEEVWLAEHPAAPHEDAGMLSEIVPKAHGPRLHRPDHHKSRPGHRVVTAIDVPPSRPQPARGTHSRPARPGTRKNILLRRAPGPTAAHARTGARGAPNRSAPDGWSVSANSGRILAGQAAVWCLASGDRRRVWDSNPRLDSRPIAVFKTAAIGH